MTTSPRLTEYNQGVRFPVGRVIAAGVLCGLIHAQTEPLKTDCILSGQILDSATGEPLRKAIVTLARQDGLAASRQRNVDAAGRFEFSGLEPGRYGLSAGHTGFLSQRYGAARPGGSGGSIISLAAGQEIQGLQLKLVRYGVVLGRVVDEDEEPVTGVSVSAQWMDSRGGMTSYGSVVTNDLGEYRLFAIPPGDFLIQAEVREDSDRTEPEIGFAVTYHPGTVDSGAASPVQVKAGTETRGIDVRMAKSRLVRVRGVVVDGATGKRVQATVVLGQLEPGGGTHAEMHSTGEMGAKGAFDLRGVAPGQYRLAAYADAPEGGLSAVQTLVVGDQNIQDVVMTLSAGTVLHGTVRVEGARSGASVHLSPVGGDPTHVGYRHAAAKPDGSFKLTNVRSGHYFVDTDGVEGGYLKSAKLGDQEVLEAGLEIPASGATALLHLVVSTNCAEVTGTLQDDEGMPWPDAIAVLLPEGKYRDQLERFAVGTADQYGAFSIKNVRPGKYSLIAVEGEDYAEWMDAEFVKLFEKTAVALTLKEGQKESRQLTLRPTPAENSERQY